MRVRWGMDERTTLAALSTTVVADRVLAAERPDRLTPAVVVRDARLASHPFTASFLFDRSRTLAAIELRTPPWDGEAFDEMRTWLSDRHGEPARETPSLPPGAVGATWATPTGSIELRAPQVVYAGVRVVELDPGSGHTERLPSDIVITYRRPGPSDRP